MKNYSLTYTGVIVMTLGFLFQHVGLPFDTGNAETTINFVVELIGVLTALYGRYRLGGINPLGNKI